MQNEIMLLIIIQMKDRWHRLEINTTRPRHGGKWTKYKHFLRLIGLIRMKQHLSNIIISNHVNVK